MLIVGIGMAFSQDTVVFNTVRRTHLKGTITVLEEHKNDVRKDSLKALLEKRKIEYNMGYLPLDSIFVTSHYGLRKHPLTGKYRKHYGVDLRGADKSVLAVQKGIVIDKGYDSRLGQFLKLRCGSFTFIYGHLKHIYVRTGELVTGGQVIAKTGGTGDVTAEHLHFGIKKGKAYIDPLPILELISEGS